jgi:hypothetical protein
VQTTSLRGVVLDVRTDVTGGSHELRLLLYGRAPSPDRGRSVAQVTGGRVIRGWVSETLIGRGAFRQWIASADGPGRVNTLDQLPERRFPSRPRDRVRPDGNDLCLELKLLEFQRYCNGHRTDAGLGGLTPKPRTEEDRAPASVSRSRWQRHGRGMYQTPIAA